MSYILTKYKKNVLTFLNHRLVRDTLWTTVFNIIGKGIGFLIPFFIAAWFGVSAETDAFFFAYGIILFFAGIFAPVVESVVVPYIAEIRANNEDASEFVSGIISLTGIGLSLLLILFLLFIRPLLSLITRFDLKTLNLIYLLLFEISPLPILLIWTSVLAGTLNAYKKFSFPALSPSFRAIINLILIFLLKDRWGVHSIVIGYLAGEIVRLLTLIYLCKRILCLRIKFYFQLTSKLKDFFIKGFYQVIGMVGVGLNPVTDKIMASWLGAGSVSILHYADRLYMIPVTFATTGLMVTILSYWSEKFYNQNQKLIIDKEINRVLKIIFLPILFITVILILISQQVVNFAFEHGSFDQGKLSELRWVWICYLLGLPGYIIGLIYVRAFLVLKCTKMLMQIAFFTVATNLLFNFVLMSILGIKGIALSTSITITLTTFIQAVFFKTKIKRSKQ